jgi:hypothetical protein
MLYHNLSSPLVTDLADELDQDDIDDSVTPPDNEVMLRAITFDGQPIFFNGGYIRFSSSPP